jgi:cholesterol oxidase
MGIQLDVTEWMKGHVGFGATEYAAGEAQGKREHTTFAHEVRIQMADIDRFTTEPHHRARMDGHVEWLGEKRPFAAGEFDMLVDSTDRRIRHMFYRIPFETADGAPLTMLGHKQLRDDEGVDLPADITTLYIQIYDGHIPGHDFSVPSPGIPKWPPGAKAVGIIHISLADGIRSAMSFDAPGASTREKLDAIGKFLRFYGRGVYDLYFRQSRTKQLVAIGAIALLAIGAIALLLRS